MKYIAIMILASMVALTACSPAEGNRRGHEYMPDMVHPIGYEASLYDYYYYNRWGSKEEYKKYVMPRHSVEGTVARGEISYANAADDQTRMAAMESSSGNAPGAIAYDPNGSVPYYYENTDAERARASREILKNPFPITDAGLEHGKALYNVYCGICHGEKGDGLGFLVREADPAKGISAGVYPAAPANLLIDTFVNASAGRLYHAIMYGKNVMGPYSDKLSYKERWEVIHYIRSLQAQSKSLEYTAASNTFNTEAQPWAIVEKSMQSRINTTTGQETSGNGNTTESGTGTSENH